MDRKAIIEENFLQVRQQIETVCVQCGRDPQEVTLIAVSKYHPVQDIALAFDLGYSHFGENRVQELTEKMAALAATSGIDWHLIGNLQRNKVKDVIGKVSLIHSVDSLKLIEKLEQQAERFDVRQDILLQINNAHEASKHGFEESSDLAEALTMLEQSPHLTLKGLMCMAPIFENAADSLPIFQECAFLYRSLQAQYGCEQISVLSMGMSSDFPYAIRAGATHVRVGTALFGPRDYT